MRIWAPAVAVLLAAPASARELAGLNLSNAAGVPVSGQTRELREPAPNFAFFSSRAGAMVVRENTAELQRRIAEEARQMGLPELKTQELKGRVILLYFWGAPARYCPSCADMTTLAEGLYDELWDKGLRAVGLSVTPFDKGVAEGNDHLVGRPVLDPMGALGLGAVPSWALIDRSGKVVAKSTQLPSRDYLSELIRAELVRK